MLATVWQTFRKAPNTLKNEEKLGDFTATPRVIWLSILAIVIGIFSTFIALVLLTLIRFFTNLFFFQRFSIEDVSPATNHLGIFVVIVPVVGALLIGLMARYGSERIRGHGIPEAIEAILVNGSKVDPKVALLKPVSAAISIGSGGPFGAEGPIIMTGGAFGSMIAQFFHFSSAERKIMLVAGAAAGMSATFDAPVAAVLLAVELLLFEWKPRSLIPVALASVTAGFLRYYFLGAGPLFPVPAHPAALDFWALLACIATGVLAGLLSCLATILVYAFEDLFHRLPLHWMWWPAIGAIAVGVGGLIFPPALGVGYDNIGTILQGNTTLTLLFGILIVKLLIWAIALGSGTSGGVLAPLLMVGCALGGLESFIFPHQGGGFWALLAMGAMLSGTMRAPLTGVIFALELTHDLNALVPLLITCMLSYGCTVLLMRRSILTEKISRRGYHLSNEYAIDPLEILFVREVMRTNIIALPTQVTRDNLIQLLNSKQLKQGKQLLFPVIDEQKHIQGVLTRNDLTRLIDEVPAIGTHPLSTYLKTNPIVAYTDENLRTVAYRMAQTGHTRFPVVERAHPDILVGIVALSDLLKARSRNLHEERQRERIFQIHTLFSSRTRVPVK
ncbi:H+/Cl- antiporter ClcA [Thermosporothrix hazakensis]|uniref:H+/Cl-antiporter ClcA n=2 Tax=Thermosporothrix TaxID=768650 RepID=A0A326U9H2_THEHA|nr:chloride channel protein [Thermosporothrix hazakensis]PZW32097.1 H+/Cl- antiporter ClcA [Thermosporothrix hazakensis]BBH91429.1 chloride channel protein [Thermosporothrix sp. COM3]GCE49575.1 chloride channel protein [Thermosporothrix hazakensis]